jgi:excisionase family DNA binding protein
MLLQDLRDGDLTVPSVHVGLVRHPHEERHPVSDDPTMSQRVLVVELLAHELGRVADLITWKTSPNASDLPRPIAMGGGHRATGRHRHEETPMNTLENSDVQFASASLLLLRVEEAALRLGIGRTSMYRLVMTGEVESVQIGGLRRIPAPCIEEYIDRLRHHAADPGA